LTNTDAVDLNKKLEQWEKLYNFNRPHGTHGGNTPNEALRTMLESNQISPGGSGKSQSEKSPIAGCPPMQFNSDMTTGVSAFRR